MTRRHGGPKPWGPMTKDHLDALLRAAEAEPGEGGWSQTPEARHVTLYAACAGVSLTVSRVEAVRLHGALLYARTNRGEVYVLALSDLFAGAVEAPSSQGRKAGFV